MEYGSMQYGSPSYQVSVAWITLPTSTAEKKPSSLGDQKKTEIFGSGRIRTKLKATCASLNPKTGHLVGDENLTSMNILIVWV